MNKPHRTSAAATFAEIELPLQDRKLSDLLPNDFIRQIGFDPESLIFNTPDVSRFKRRVTDPCLVQFNRSKPSSRRNSQYDSYLIMDNTGKSLFEIAKKGEVLECYLVELSDVTVDAFAIKHLSQHATDSVFVRDGPFLRLGKILKRIKTDECDKEALQIIYHDEDGSINDYFGSLTQIVSSVAPAFAVQCNCTLKILDVEFVSYQARVLIRTKVDNVSDPMLAELLQKLITVFMCPVEIYSDL